MASKISEARTEEKSWRAPKALPEHVGACIAILVKAKRERKRREAEALTVKAVEEQIADHIIELLSKEKLGGAKSPAGTVTISEKDIPQISDYEAFCTYVAEKQAWDLFQRRAGEAACQARWETGEQIPGVVKFHKKTLSLTETKGA